MATGRRLMACAILASATLLGCDDDDAPKGPQPLPIPTASDPEGKDLELGAVVMATEPVGGVRLYKVKEINYMPPPLTDEIVFIAFKEKGMDWEGAAKLWQQRNLTVEIPHVPVYRHIFADKRDYRVLTVEPLTEADKALGRGDKLGPLGTAAPAPTAAPTTAE